MTTSTADEQTATASAASQEQKPEKRPKAAPQKPRVAPAKGKSGKKATPAKKAPKAPKATKVAKGEQKPGAAREGSKTAKVLDLLRAAGRRHPEGDHESHRLAAAQRPRVHQRRPGKEDGTHGRVHQARGRRAGLQPAQVALPCPVCPPGSGRGGLFCFMLSNLMRRSL